MSSDSVSYSNARSGSGSDSNSNSNSPVSSSIGTSPQLEPLSPPFIPINHIQKQSQSQKSQSQSPMLSSTPPHLSLNPDGRFQRVIGNLQNQRFSICEQIRASFLEEQDIRELLAEFWTPSLQIIETAKRIRSSSIDEPKPPEIHDKEIIDELFNEIGCNPSILLRQLQMIDEIMPEKLVAMKLIEMNLKDVEKTLSKYQSVVKEFQDKFADLQQIIGTPIYMTGKVPDPEFQITEIGNLQHIEPEPEHRRFVKDCFKDDILEYCRKKNLPELLKNYQKLKFELEYCRLPFEYLKKKTSHVEAPNCHICLTKPISIAITPCGHTICDSCCKTIHIRGKCPFCRHTITEFFKIYI